ncbi:bifunctional PIG-L family deacetylase/class I SAM-dependent methyltransferase [Sanguibacter antarcticus]|uniref:bifunctional PIG-L family deacetylase/class I SAM-dependent methyltransferase n=1 Tax=Sanguibacter antarcticus TaxID=372484 RepID=UPI001FE64836|nr:bifunctional PIG-L family deacetylase/class I SAM-dependent methyltransferase [Sanguibacter antarcticus]
MNEAGGASDGRAVFDHRDAGTSEALWASALHDAALPALDVEDVTHLVVLAAHPDDETLGAAGLVAHLSRRGVKVTVVVATDGDASHPGSPTHTPADLVRVRRAELLRALGTVAPGAAVHLLALPDGGLRENAHRLRDALGAVLDSARDSARDGAVGGVGGVGGVLLAAPWSGDRHRDHRAAGEVAREVAASRGVGLVEYPVWMWHWAAPDDAAVPWDRLAHLDLGGPERAAKAAALGEHASQTAPLSSAPGDEAMLGPEMLRHFDRPVEVFVVAQTQTQTRAQAPDRATLPQSFFDDFYTGRSDPWGFETRWYEERKRAVTLASLPRPRFGSGLEVGCSTGVLTAELAERCDTLVAVDIAAAPLEAARARVGDRATFLQLATPHEWPPGSFDLVVLSEVGYYYGPADLAALIDRVVASLTPDGVVVACHWRHPVAEYPASGDTVHAALESRTDLARLARHVEEDFLLDVLVRPPAVSVATRAGLA